MEASHSLGKLGLALFTKDQLNFRHAIGELINEDVSNMVVRFKAAATLQEGSKYLSANSSHSRPYRPQTTSTTCLKVSKSTLSAMGGSASTTR